jgi:hypothetical protein
MPGKLSDTMSPADLRQNALSRWDNEGGAGVGGPQEGEAVPRMPPEISALTDSELVQLRIRVIALENVVIGLLAQASDEQLKMVREMAAYIAPRPGFTPHPLTIRASAHMVDLVHRAGHFRPAQS